MELQSTIVGVPRAGVRSPPRALHGSIRRPSVLRAASGNPPCLPAAAALLVLGIASWCAGAGAGLGESMPIEPERGVTGAVSEARQLWRAASCNCKAAS